MKSYVTATPIALGGVEAAKQQFAGNKMFSADDWNKYLAQGRLGEYVQTLSDFEKNVDYDKFAADLDIKYLTGDQKLLAMQNELYNNKTDEVEKKRTITREDGSSYEETYKTTEYKYVNDLLKSQIAYNKATKLAEESEQLKTVRDKVGDAFKAIPQGIGEGMISLLGDVYNLLEGIGRAASVVTPEGMTQYGTGTSNALEAMDNAFRSAFTDTGWDDEVTDWLQKNIFLYEEGDYAQGFARYTYSAAESFGRIVPGMILNGIGKIAGVSGQAAVGLAKTSQVAYYTGMASGNLKETYRDPTMTTRPTLELIANAAVKTAFEIGVEHTLGKVFGTTTLDNMAFGYGTKAASAISGKNAIARIFKDALQEGMEEYFQDYSAYFIDRVFSTWAEEYKNCSDWTLQGAFDAFILGAAMSIGGSMLRVATTKKVSTGQIDEKTGKYKKLSKLQSYSYNLTLQSVIDEVNSADFEKMSQNEQASIVGGVFTTLSAISAMYGEFGEERIQVAQKILDKINQGRTVTNDEIAFTVNRLVSELQLGEKNYKLIKEGERLTNIAAIEKIIQGAQNKNIAELREELANQRMSGEITDITQTNTVEEIKEKLDVDDEVANTIQRIMKGTGKDVLVVENGTGLLETEKVVIMAKQFAVDFDADTNMRTLSEQRVISAVLTDSELQENFDDIRTSMVGPDGKPYTAAQFVTMLLYDETFAYTLLYNGDKTLISLISRLDNIAKFIVKDREIADISAKDIQLITNRLHSVLFNFYKGAPYINPGEIEQSTILSKDEKRQLKAYNWQKGIYGKIMERNELPSKEDLNVLEIMVNSYTADKDTKAQMIADLNSGKIGTIKTVLKKLVTQFETNFKGKFNGHMYLEYNGNPLNAEFNTFLISHGVTIDQILGGNVDPKIAEEIMKVQGSVTPNACVKYYQDLYKQEYRHEFIPDFINNTVNVKEGTARVYGNKTLLQDMTDIQADRDYKTKTALIKKSYDLHYKIFADDVTKFEKVNATIDDIIKDPRLQSKEVQTMTKSKYGNNSPKSTYLYLRDYIVNKSGGQESILVDNNGNYYIASVESADLVGTTKLAKDGEFKGTNDIIAKVAEDPVDGSATLNINDYISKKYLNVFGKDNAPSLELEAMTYRDNDSVVIDRTTYGYYDETTNTIVINGNIFGNDIAQNRRTFNWVLMHEFRHALQAVNGLTLGFGDFLTNINKKAAKPIIMDLRKHFPTAFGKDYDYDTDVEIANDILYKMSGEADAIGYSQELDIYPLAIQRSSTGAIQKIIMPWGTEYDKKGIVGQKVVSKSMKYKPGVGYTMSVNNVLNDDAKANNIINDIVSVTRTTLNQNYRNNILTSSKMLTVFNTAIPDVDNKYWRDLELQSSIEFSDYAKNDWKNFYTMSSSQKLVKQLFPGMSINEARTELMPMAVITFDVWGQKNSYVSTDISNRNLKNVITYLSRNDAYKNARITVAIESVSVGSFLDGTVYKRGNISDIIRLPQDYLGIPQTDVIDVTNTFSNKEVIIIGIDKIRDFANSVLSTYDTTDKESISNVAKKLVNIAKAIRTDVEVDRNITLDDWKKVNESNIFIAKQEMLKFYKDGTFNEKVFNASFDQYVQDVFDLAHFDALETYMWNSGNTSANDPRRIKAKQDLMSEIDKHPDMFQKMMRVAKFQIAPMLTYNEFMNMDIPFVRIVTQSQKNEGLFSGSSLGTVNLDTQINLIKSYNEPYKFYIGTVKPKDTLGFTISGEYEVLLKDSTIANAQEVTVVPKTDNKFYLLGEEYGDIAQQIKGVTMVSPEGVSLDTKFSFLKGDTRPRYVSHENAQNSNLRYYVRKGEVIQMDPRLQDLNINSTGVENDLDPYFVKKIKGGKLRTKSDLYQYIQKAWTFDNYKSANKEQRVKLEATFKLINENYFGNTAIPNLKALVVLMDTGMADYYAARASLLKYCDEHPDNAKLRGLLTATTNAANLQEVVKYLRDNQATDELFKEFRKAFDVYRGTNVIDLGIGQSKMLVPMMSTFDGTLDMAGKIASNVRWTSIVDARNNYKTNVRLGKEGDEEVGIEETIADTVDRSGITKTEDKAEWLVNYFVDNDMQGQFWKSTKDYFEARKKLRSIYETKVDNMSDTEIGAIFDNVMLGEDTGRIAKSDSFINEVKGNERVITVKSTYNIARSTAKRIVSKLTKEQLAKFVDAHPDLGIDKDGNYTYPHQQRIAPTMDIEGRNNILLMRRDYNAKLEEALDEVLKSKYGLKSEQKIIAQQQKRIARLEQDLAEAMNMKGKTEKQVSVIVEGNGVITAADNAKIPDTLQKVFETEFSDTAKTEVKYLSEENEVHFKRNYETFIDQNADYLAGLKEADIDEIISFYERFSLAPNAQTGDTYTKFTAIRQYMLMYMYKLGSEGLIPLSPENMKRIEGMFKAIKSTAGTELSISREAQEIINPVEVIVKSLQKVYGVEVSDTDVDALRLVVKRDYAAQAKAAGVPTDVYRVQELNKVLRRIETSTLEQLKGRPRNKVDQILKWQRTAMLSSVGTWTRNIVSNAMLDVTNKASDIIGDKVFGLLNKSSKTAKRDLPSDQYKIVGTKLNKADASDRVIIDWIDKSIRESGIMDLVADGLTKYDASATAHKSAAPSDVLAQLVVNGTMAKLSNQTTFPEGNHWWTKAISKAGNGLAKLLYGYVDSKGDLHQGVMTDTKAVMKSFYSYLGVMIKEDIQAGRITANDLNQGLNNRKMLDIVSNAYVMASYDYMHKPNIFNKIDGLIRQRTNDACYFVWKQFEPFAAAGWNWFMKGLEYTPIGLATSIARYIKLENYIAKMEKTRNMQIAPTERFATYLTKRSIGSGIIGTIGMAAGMLLTSLGVAGIDDDDGKPKLFVGDISVDISNIFGTSGMLAGMAIGGTFAQAASKNQSWFEALIDGTVGAFDVMFTDSVFADVFDLMQSRETLTEVLINKIGSMAGMFVPNMLKTALSYTTVVTPKYASGVLGQIERQLVQVLPTIAYALPRRYDIYTGETQYKYNMPWMDRWYDAVAATLANYASPVKIKRRTASDLEVLATSLGVSKGELTGKYSDIGTLDRDKVAMLNNYYGQLNNTTLEQFVNNQKKYTVEDSKGKRVTLFYAQMTDAQKKSVITRIMSDNAKYAKVYVGTQMGYKYYASDDDYKALSTLGIKNVYHKSSKLSGFVK